MQTGAEVQVGARAIPLEVRAARGLCIIGPNELRTGSGFLIKTQVKEFADERRSPGQLVCHFPLLGASFAFSIGISSSCWLHLTIPGVGIARSLTGYPSDV
jgi:hypothetical protein